MESRFTCTSRITILRTSTIYAEHKALIRIADGATIRGELPATALRLVEQWRALHFDELVANWMLAQEPAALSRIDPLQ